MLCIIRYGHFPPCAKPSISSDGLTNGMAIRSLYVFQIIMIIKPVLKITIPNIVYMNCLQMNDSKHLKKLDDLNIE